MTAANLEAIAHEIFKASAGQVGPLAVRITRKGRGGLGMVSVEVLGAAPHVRAIEGLFFSLVNRLDLFDDGVFVDVADVETLIAHPWRLAREGLARCKAIRGGALDPVGDDLLELVADALVWRLALQQKRIPTPVEAIAHASTAPASPGLDLPAVLQAAAFQRLSRVPPEGRQLGAVAAFFGQAATTLAEEDRVFRESFLDVFHEANEALRETERAIRESEQRLASIEGGSLNPIYREMSFQVSHLRERQKRQEKASNEAQRAAWLAQQSARGEARRRLYGPPEEAPPAATDHVDEAPPAA
jgi:hypothetical protein